MNKSEFISVLASEMEVPKKTAKKFLDNVLEIIKEEVAEGNTVNFIGFGVFKSSNRAAKKGRNPQTGEEIEIPAMTVPTFVPGKNFKDAVNGDIFAESVKRKVASSS